VLVAAILAAVFAPSTAVDAAPTGAKEEAKPPKADKATELYNKGLELVEAGDFEKALEQFGSADRERKNDPEILNMLAFTKRKLGRLDEAFEIYAKALSIRSDFPQAREYLGEAHIQAALEQVRILRSYGASGEEELRQLLAAFEEAAYRLGLGNEPRSGAAPRKW
jgi:tetratricopeptide (TPR) repeat protein